jgi:hypothetical protein
MDVNASKSTRFLMTSADQKTTYQSPSPLTPRIYCSIAKNPRLLLGMLQKSFAASRWVQPLANLGILHFAEGPGIQAHWLE